MKDQFVTYEIAKRLKQLGFDSPCFGYYTPVKSWMMNGTRFNPEPHYHGPNWPNEDNTFRFMYVQNSFGDRDSVTSNSKFTKAVNNVAAPLIQQAIDWLDERNTIITPVYNLEFKSFSSIVQNHDDVEVRVAMPVGTNRNLALYAGLEFALTMFEEDWKKGFTI